VGWRVINIVHDRIKIEQVENSGVFEDQDVFLAKCDEHGVVGKWRKSMDYAKRDYRRHHRTTHEVQLSLMEEVLRSD
jgi:hypothetical protein